MATTEARAEPQAQDPASRQRPAPEPGEPIPQPHEILVIGAGLVGLSTAWLLQQRGHRVVLLDGGAPDAGGREGQRHGSDPLRASGSEAALGVLMAAVFQRSSGRALRLRQRSQLLWRQWRQELASRGRPLPWRPGLLLLAASEADVAHQRALLDDPRRPPGSLRWLRRDQLEGLWPPPPAAALGGLLSPDDGQLDPHAALSALRTDALAAGLEIRHGWAEALDQHGTGWRVRLSDGERIAAPWVVISAGLGSTALIPPDRRQPPLTLEPVLGQALELELTAEDSHAAAADGPSRAINWPGAVVWRGTNLIHRQGLAPGGAGTASGDAHRSRLWLGATLEPGDQASAGALERLRDLEGAAPDWLRRAREIRRWQGLRARPAGEAAPVLQDLGDGLLLASGHYRNGVLLAPASAEWVAERIESRAGAI